MKKRLLALLLAVVMVAAMIPASVFAEDELQTDGYNWSKWEYSHVDNYKGKLGCRAIKAEKGDKVQYLYAVVEDFVYDGVAVGFVEDNTTKLEHNVRFIVDTYNHSIPTSSKILVKDKGTDYSNYTTSFAEFEGEGYDQIASSFKYYYYTPFPEAKIAAKYSVNFILYDDDFYRSPLAIGWTGFEIEHKSILDDDILKDVKKTNFYFTGEEFAEEDLFDAMGITLQDSRIVTEDELYYVLEEDDDYELELVGVKTEEGYDDFDYTREYLQNDPAYVLVKGDGNYCDTWEIPVVFEKPIVSFESNGGSVVDAQKVDYGTCAVKPEDPTKEGYKFAGWYDEKLEVAYDFETPVEEDTILYAKWVANVNTGVTTNSNMTLIIAGGMILLALAVVAVVLKKRASQK